MQRKNEDESREGKAKQDELKSYNPQRWRGGERAIRGCIDLNFLPQDFLSTYIRLLDIYDNFSTWNVHISPFSVTLFCKNWGQKRIVNDERFQKGTEHVWG